MKRFLILLATVLIASASTLSAQNYMVVNSQKIFQSMKEYNNTIEELNALSEQYQQKVDEAYAQIEEMYNAYQQERANMSAAVRQTREDAIISNEKKVAEYQEQVFGTGGTLMQTRIEKLKPIQDKVFEAIEKYAKANGFDLVLDIASNPTILYYTPSADRTEQIINQLK
ncbi:MAG: OmpH family outer membrane protein [Tidjanibacter sp.]|nr:OmpH family outer membrane protein [Tidjanibacter sp.]